MKLDLTTLNVGAQNCYTNYSSDPKYVSEADIPAEMERVKAELMATNLWQVSLKK